MRLKWFCFIEESFSPPELRIFCRNQKNFYFGKFADDSIFFWRNVFVLLKGIFSKVRGRKISRWWLGVFLHLPETVPTYPFWKKNWILNNIFSWLIFMKSNELTVSGFESQHKLYFIAFYTKKKYFFQTPKSTPCYECFQPYARRRP